MELVLAVVMVLEVEEESFGVEVVLAVDFEALVGELN